MLKSLEIVPLLCSYFVDFMLTELIFFRRQRNYNPDVSPYNVNFNSLRTSQSNQISLDVTNTENGHAFVLDLFGFEDRTFRLKINEASPLKPRYEVPDVIGDIKSQS